TATIRLERAVAAVAVQHGRRPPRCGDEQVEEPVVVVVADCDRGGSARRSRLRQAASRRRVLEPALSSVPEQRQTSVFSRNEQVEPSVVVVVTEGGGDGPIAQPNAGAGGRLGGACQLVVEQASRNEHVLAAVAVVIASRQRGVAGGVGERRHVCEPGGGGHVAEADRRRDRARVLRRRREYVVEREDRVARESAARAPPLLEARLVGCGRLLIAMVRRSWPV